MVRISDEEKSTFDAPVETVWQYLQHPEAHGGSHKSSRNRSMKPLSENSFIVSWEQDLNGTWVKVSNKITSFPPLGMVSEQLEGPMAGSKIFTIYTPKGSKTEVAVHGEMVSPTIPPAQLESMVRRAWENAYNEDAAGIRAFAAKK
jgi:hypothetical protein